MMRKLIIISAVFFITACGGGGGKGALIKACMEEGEDKKDCECMAEQMEQGLSPRAFEAMVLSATGKDEDAEAIIEELGMTEGIAIAGVMMKVVSECGISGLSP